jgi:rhamnose utilization protein RhaD (predicted bifunctional aldolase and dehydrogenase)
MSTTPAASRLEEMLRLSHELGQEDRHLAILGEGNTSVRLDSETFLVKASGRNLANLTAEGVTECRFDKILPLFDEKNLPDEEMNTRLLAARTNSQHGKPSIESLFHAYLLTLPGIEYVGHVHATNINSILCSGQARTFAESRLFPDDVVCCGPASVLVPYCDPGADLALAIRDQTEKFIKVYQTQPRVILLESHGVITIGSSRQSVLAATLMAEKAATIFLGASALGNVKFMTPEQVTRIAGRPDEHYRQRALGM